MRGEPESHQPPTMPAPPTHLYMLPFDHRSSFEHGLFGWRGRPTIQHTAQVIAAKQVIYEALLQAIAEGVPRDRAALLVDEEYGREILADARARGLITACPVEKSGQAEFELEHGDAFAVHIETMDPTYCKVLVRYNPRGDAAVNQRQAERLRRLSAYLHHAGRRFLFELLVPAEPAQLVQVAHDPQLYDRTLRPALTAAAIRELQDTGIEPDVWKLEGFERREDCVAVAEIAQRDGRGAVRCIILGRHAEAARVHGWLAIAATVPSFVGFAVGRSTFWDPLRELLTSRTRRPQAVATIARTYRGWVETWETARGERGERARDVQSQSDRQTLR
ncbi:MAG: IolC myo-catabolism protein [Myxococcales bacterium]|nr:IolC myo-catabolism protein [Myxococcales bacterium]